MTEQPKGKPTNGVWDGEPLMYAHSKHWEDCEQGKDWLRVRRKKLCECEECKNDKT